MRPSNKFRAGIVAILTLALLFTVTIQTELSAQVSSSWERTDATLKQAPSVMPAHLTVHTRQLSPNYWQATVYSSNPQEIQTIYVQTQDNTQSRFAPPAHNWSKMAGGTYTNPNLTVATPNVNRAYYYPTTAELEEQRQAELRKPPVKYGRTLAEMGIRAGSSEN